MLRFCLWFVLLVNLAAFLAMGVDKLCAVRSWRRIPETHLLWLAFFAGAPGIWFGSSIFRHKTIKKPFRRRLILATVGNLLWIAIGWQLWQR